MDKMNPNPFGLSGQSYSPAELAKRRAETYNKHIIGDLTGYDCPKCRNRGCHAIPREDGTVGYQDCECVNIRNCLQKMESSGLRDVIKDFTFEAYQDTQNWQTTIKQGAMGYADKPDGWLLFCGQSGSGKTHLCTAVCRQLLLAGKEVRYMPWRQDTRELKGMEASKQVDELKKLQTAPILFIDDLFKTARAGDGSMNPTPADVNLAFDIINYRYTKRLTTIISTERMPIELVDIDEAIGGRIVEMANGRTFCIDKRPERNYRLRGIVTV